MTEMTSSGSLDPHVRQTNGDDEALLEVSVVPFDENLLERSRTQWQFGDWQSLALLKRATLQHHPDRAKLALLAAAGHMQCGSVDQARGYVRLAKEWGCDKKLVRRILIAGVHNSLGRMAALAGEETRAMEHFEHSIELGARGNDTRLLREARIMHQYGQMGLTLPRVGIQGAIDPAE